MTKQDIEMVVKAEVSVYEREAVKLIIDSPEDMERAVTILSETNKVADRVKDEKEKITVPLNEALKAERARWKPIEDACANAVSIIKSKMIAYQRLLEVKNKEKEDKLMKRVDKGTMKVETAVGKMEALPDTKASVATGAGMIMWKTVKKLVISDALLIPREYLIVDEVKVKEALKNGIVVAGASLVEEKTPSNFR
jgi:hypothetical protein